VKGFHISLALDFTSRDENIRLVAEAVPVYRHARRAAVVEEDIYVAPGLVVVGDDVVLQVADSFFLLKGGALDP
jgi:hypothetical protein